MTPKEKALALVKVCEALIQTIEEAGDQGAPAGILYTAMMAHGCSLEQFERIMSLLVEAGRVRKSNHVYYAVKR